KKEKKMLSYILEVSICWLFFYSIYKVFLNKETFFRVNRWYLLSTLILGLMLPLARHITLDWMQPSETLSAYIEPISVGLQNVQELPQNNLWTVMNVLGLAYLFGVVFFTFRFLFGLSQICKLYLKADKYKDGDLIVVNTKSDHLPFSFFNLLFWSESFHISKEEKDKIISHEQAHINGFHSVDVIFTELISILFWCSPMIYLYKKSIKATHEFLADAFVLKLNTNREYKKLLIENAVGDFQLALTNQFFNSQLKERIKMINKKRSSKWAGLKYLAILPAVIILVGIFAFKNDQVKLSSDLQTDPIYKEVDELPRFPGCEEIEDEIERTNCAKNKLLMFVYKNIKYPEEARKAGIEGQVVAQFVIEKDGSVSNFKKIRDIGGGCGDAAISSMQLMNTKGIKWIPGIKNGEKVRVQFTMPVTFKLAEETESSTNIKVNGDKTDAEGPEDFIYLLDGKEISLEKFKSINRNAIESINIIKDKSAEERSPKYKGKTIIEVSMTKDKSSLLPPPPPPPPPAPGTLIQDGVEVFKVVEQMPRFPGCEDISDKKEKEACARDKMLRFLYTQIKYPAEARISGVQGMVVAQFIVRKDGNLTDLKLLRDIGAGCGNEALRVIESMNQMEDKWIPGRQRGKLVDVQFTLPVRFKLEGENPLPNDGNPSKHMTVVGHKPESNEYALFQNEPNPFVSETRIGFHLPQASDVVVRISGVNGKQLKTIKGEFEKGYNQIKILRSDIPTSGVVYYSIEAGDFKKTMKMIILD
ncbi:MAG: TonB family protein, partial [Bacteroidota bacterium]